jgi:restriction endonuclease S subunit
MTSLTAMPKYEVYKDSGGEWLGNIPGHWRVIRLKNAAFINPVSDISSCDLDEVVCFLPMEKVGTDGAVEYDQYRTLRSVKQGFTSFQNNDVIIAKITPCFENGKGAHLKNMPTKFGYGSTEFHVLRAYKNYNPAFLYYLTKSHLFMYLGEQLMTGSAGQKRVPTSFISDFLFASPSEDEQTAIANFLDEKTAKIDEAIAIKEKQIELLKERKQIIIQQAVTQGLDPTVPMKDSGVEWIGQIPAHWNVVKLKYPSTQIVDGTHFTPTYVDQGIPFLRVTDLSNMVDGKINWQDVCYIPEKEHNTLIKRAKGEIGDVLISKNGTIGLTKVIDWDEEFSFFVSLCLIKLRKEISPYYFTSFFNSPIVDQQITFGSSKTSVTNLHLEKIKELLVILPPLNEQNDIDEYVKANSKDLDLVIGSLLKQIEKLNEYKTTLINSAVTGKIKVV